MKKKTYSLKLYNAFVLLIILLPSIAISGFVYQRNRADLLAQTAQINHDYLEVYTEQIDTELVDVSAYLTGDISTLQETVDLQLSANETTRELAKASLFTAMQKASRSFQRVGGFFVYAQSEWEDVFIGAQSVRFDYVFDIKGLQAMLEKAIAGGTLQSGLWQNWEIGGQWYLVRTYYERDTYFGCWIKLDTLTSPLKTIDLGEDGFLLVSSQQGEALTNTDRGLTRLSLDGPYNLLIDQGKYVQITSMSAIAPIGLSAVIPYSAIMSRYDWLSGMILAMIVLLLATLGISALLLNILVSRPISRFHKRIVQGRHNLLSITRVPSRISEFDRLDEAFFDMTQEIETLKLSIYEEKLREKEAQLEYLQLQIEPHFYVNCMNLMCNMIQLGRNEETLRLIHGVVEYFRYASRGDGRQIEVYQEMKHVSNYLDIQRIRIGDVFDYAISVDEAAQSALIPPMSIQTFIENAMKYAYQPGVRLLGSVAIARRCERLRIVIRDNGRGFTAKALMALNANQPLEERGRRCIGIFNVMARMGLIYEDDASFRFYNDGGAVIVMELPCQRPDLLEAMRDV